MPKIFVGKGKHKHEARTGDELAEFAESVGAMVKQDGSFNAISTPLGTIKIAPGDKTWDKQTISRIKRAFRALGLLVLMVFITPFIAHFMGYLS